MIKKFFLKLLGKDKKIKVIPSGKKNKKVLIYSSGQAFVTDANGQDIETAGKNWFLVYLEYLDSVGVDPLECEFAFESGHKVIISKTETVQNGKTEKKLNYHLNNIEQ